MQRLEQDGRIVEQAVIEETRAPQVVPVAAAGRRTEFQSIGFLDSKKRKVSSDEEVLQQHLLSFDEIRSGLNSEDPDLQLGATQAARKILSRKRKPPIEDFIEAGILPRLVYFLSKPALQLEAAWALTNIASGSSDQTKAVVEAGAVPALITLLSSECTHVKEQAVWALGNIAGDGSAMRDLVIQIVEPLLAFVRSDISVPFLKIISWTMANLCQNKYSPPTLEIVQMCMPTLFQLAQHSDTDIMVHGCWAISYLTDGSTEQIQEVVDTGVVPYLVRLLSSGDLKVMIPSLRSLGNIVNVSEGQIYGVLETGPLHILADLLKHPCSRIVREATRTIANIIAGNEQHIQMIIDAQVVPPLIEVLVTGTYASKKEAIWAVHSITSFGTVEQTLVLLHLGVLKPMFNLLGDFEEDMVNLLLDGISNILDSATHHGESEYVDQMIEECRGLDKLEDFQVHEDEYMRNKVLDIIETFFSSE